MTVRGRSGESGSTLIIVALFMVALMTITALVIDLGLVRQNRQTDKSATDFAAAAGIRGMDDGTGSVNVWEGICAARNFLVVNNEEEFSPLTAVDAGGNPTTDPCVSPPTVYCNSASDYRTYYGVAGGGRIRVTIHGGYELPDPAFAEDLASGSYDGETGDGCDHLAVIVEETESSYFGAAVGSSGHTTRIRSVGRLEQSTTDLITAALLILEQTDCPALLLEGSSGAEVVVGDGINPGVIHADSLASGGSCASGKVLQVNGASTPVVTARATSTAPGQITTVSATTNPGASSSGTPSPVCVETAPAVCTGGTIQSRGLVGRGVVDVRYREPIIDLRDDATTVFALNPTTAADLPGGWSYRACNAPGPFTESMVWIDCNGGNWDGRARAFTGTNQTVAIDGHITVEGGGNGPASDPAKQLFMADVDRLYVRGASGQQAIRLAGTNNSIQINNGSPNAVCPSGPTGDLADHTEIVVGRGPIVAEGGSGKVLRMCNAMAYMMDSSGTPSCPVPSTDGAPPYSNGCLGYIRVAGDNGVDWTAPNFTNGPGAAYYDDFEDLAFWSETQSGHGIEGNGGVTLSGIFFTPNATPFRVGGNGAYNIVDAQFITRRLQVAGQATLTMAPEPNNSIQIPQLGGFGLVR